MIAHNSHLETMSLFLKRIIFLIASFLLIITSGCEQQNTEKQVQTTQSQQPKSAGYLRLPIKNPVKTLDPGWAYTPAQIEVVEQLFLGLTDFDPKTYEVIPQLATSWKASKDGKVYTFKLRQDVKWTDGKPVTAHDIAWTIWRNLALETELPYVFTLYLIKNAEALHKDSRKDIFPLLKEDEKSTTSNPKELGVWAIDDHTIEFTLAKPAGYFPALVSLWPYRPLPRHILETKGHKWTQIQNIQTNGPYQLAEWEVGKKLILKKNPDYYEAKSVAIPEIHYHVVPKSSLALAMYEKNELDIIGGSTYLYLSDKEMSRIKLNPVLRREVKISPQFCTEWYGFNTQLPPMDQLLVRKAIAAAISKPVLTKVLLQENHSPARTFTPYPVFGSIPPENKKGIRFNPRQAKAWLEKAGYPNGEGFPTLVLIHHASKSHHKVANGIKAMLKHYLNIEVEVREIDWLSYLDMIEQPKEAHLFRMGWCADYPDADSWLYELFHPSQGINWIKWQNTEFAKLVDKAQRLSDPERRKRLYHRAEQMLVQDVAAIIPLYFSMTPLLVKPWVKDWYDMAFGGQHIRHWALEN